MKETFRCISTHQLLSNTYIDVKDKYSIDINTSTLLNVHMYM